MKLSSQTAAEKMNHGYYVQVLTHRMTRQTICLFKNLFKLIELYTLPGNVCRAKVVFLCFCVKKNFLGQNLVNLVSMLCCACCIHYYLFVELWMHVFACAAVMDWVKVANSTSCPAHQQTFAESMFDRLRRIPTTNPSENWCSVSNERVFIALAAAAANAAVCWL